MSRCTRCSGVMPAPCFKAIQSVVVSVWMRTIASFAACEYGSRLTKACHPAWLLASPGSPRTRCTESVPHSSCGKSR